MEEVAKSSKKKRVEDGPGGGGGGEVENGAEKAVAVTGKGSEDPKYAPLRSFSAAELSSQVLDCCKEFARPSPIQAHAWPFLLDGRDFIGIAATGSGKTIAFGVPALMHIRKKVGRKAGKKAVPRCLVLSPTRELAQQIADVLSEAGTPCGINSVCLYGGTSKGPQIAALKSGVDIVIGTPGRMKDLIEMGICHLNEVSFVVLDEADRMLDLGFEPEVRAILSQTSSGLYPLLSLHLLMRVSLRLFLVRQMVMFSATWPLAVHKLAQEFMDPNPIKVVIGSEDLAANHDVMQIVEVLDDRSRDSRLVALLDKYHQAQRGWKAVSVHGDKAQHDRTKALSLFKEGKCPLMIATDVASRGLDIPDVEVVINYSYPLTTEDYVHRIGRTGRAGKKGVAHTFFTQENKGLAGELVNVLREAGQVVPPALTKFGTHVKKKESKIYGSHFKEITADAPKSTKITFGDSDED
ncbi:DEAD-box ATP-dependent RNA helicase 5 [Dichanthelium oligosanthes]|uniref:RNA helicase n=1 Tax=Dichanthelium oligosanthes TaxID=888268 RepID=A0A1E5UKY6_9POAL|nr:DEAD-box ATP-dependent RNA helicase 5 [Dichanthelium oligosanthes]